MKRFAVFNTNANSEDEDTPCALPEINLDSCVKRKQIKFIPLNFLEGQIIAIGNAHQFQSQIEKTNFTIYIYQPNKKVHRFIVFFQTCPVNLPD